MSPVLLRGVAPQPHIPDQRSRVAYDDRRALENVPIRVWPRFLTLRSKPSFVLARGINANLSRLFLLLDNRPLLRILTNMSTPFTIDREVKRLYSY